MPEIAADNILKKTPNKTKKIFHVSCLLAADGFTWNIKPYFLKKDLAIGDLTLSLLVATFVVCW